MKLTMAEILGFVIGALVLGAIIATLKLTNIPDFFRHYFESGTPHY